MKYILVFLILVSSASAQEIQQVWFKDFLNNYDLLVTRKSKAFNPESFNQEKFDNYLDQGEAVLLNFTDHKIEELDNFIVRMAVRHYGVIEMQGKGPKVPGKPIVGIFHKNTTCLIYSKRYDKIK